MMLLPMYSKPDFLKIGTMNTQHKSEALGAIHESMEALHEIGAISKTTMREFDEACLKPVKPLTPEDIRALRGVSAARNIKAPQNYDTLSGDNIISSRAGLVVRIPTSMPMV